MPPRRRRRPKARRAQLGVHHRRGRYACEPADAVGDCLASAIDVRASAPSWALALGAVSGEIGAVVGAIGVVEPAQVHVGGKGSCIRRLYLAPSLPLHSEPLRRSLIST
jgi:hypothetical protein